MHDGVLVFSAVIMGHLMYATYLSSEIDESSSDVYRFQRNLFISVGTKTNINFRQWTGNISYIRDVWNVRQDAYN